MASANDGIALLVMDLIENIVSQLPVTPAYLARVSRALAAAREKGIPIIHVTISFRAGYPEVPRSNKFWGRIASTDAFVRQEGDGQRNPGLEFVPEAAPQPGEPVVDRARISAFAYSDLEAILRTMGVREMVLAGVATSGVVLSTVREGMDKDYEITVLEDLCLDRDEEVHRVLTTKVFPKNAEVIGWEEWIAKL